MALSPLLAEALSGPDLWSQPRGQAILLLCGLGVLAVTLLILMLTRWGQAKILSKCIALSVFAHLLLLVYAYGIRLFQDSPIPPREHVMQLSVVADLDASAEAATAKPHAEIWDRPADESVIAPTTETPTRQPEADRPLLPERSATAWEEPPKHPIRDTPRVPDTIQAPDQLSDTEAAPAPLELPPPEPAGSLPEEPQPVEASDSSPAAPTPPRRLEVDEQDAQPLAMGPDESPSDASEAAQQRLTDLPVESSAAEAIQGPQDELSETRLPSDQPPEIDAGSPPPMATSAADIASAQPPRPHADSTANPAHRSLSDQAIPPVYRSRFTEDRAALLERFGGSQQTEAAVQAALAWLAANQSADGRWYSRGHGGGRETRVYGHDRGGAGADADTGITALALLAFLGAGQTHLDGDYQEHVRAGLEFLARNQARDGNLAGPARLFARMYCHGMATLAISEAYAVTGDPQLRPIVERAIAYTVYAQHPVGGGWRYQPGDEGDTSQFGWQLMALRSAELGGIPISPRTRSRLQTFLGRVATGPQRGLASYRPGSGPSPTMTAEALACHLFLGNVPSQAALAEAVPYLLRETPASGAINLYYWYYGTVALFQLQGPAWSAWNQDLKTRLLGIQEPAGSWPLTTVWASYGGRVYTTAMATLCLEVYYRHLPLYTNTP